MRTNKAMLEGRGRMQWALKWSICCICLAATLLQTLLVTELSLPGEDPIPAAGRGRMTWAPPFLTQIQGWAHEQGLGSQRTLSLRPQQLVQGRQVIQVRLIRVLSWAFLSELSRGVARPSMMEVEVQGEGGFSIPSWCQMETVWEKSKIEPWWHHLPLNEDRSAPGFHSMSASNSHLLFRLVWIGFYCLQSTWF